jgi:hypothetical protein
LCAFFRLLSAFFIGFSKFSLSNLLVLDVTAHFDLIRQSTNRNFEPILNLLQDLVVFVVTTETDSQTFGTESTGSSNSVQVGIRVFWHVVVENDVHSLDIDTSSEEIGGDQDSSLEVFEQRVSFESFLLVHGPVDVDGREVLVFEELVQRDAPLDRLDEDDDLVEFERVEKVEQFSVLFLFFELAVVSSETVEGELGVVVNVDLHWVGHELFADGSHFF